MVADFHAVFVAPSAIGSARIMDVLVGSDAPASGVVIAHTHIPAGGHFADVSVMPHDAAAFARALYAALHRGDAAGAELIVVEAPPEAPEWSGIADRLRRAAA